MLDFPLNYPLCIVNTALQVFWSETSIGAKNHVEQAICGHIKIGIFWWKQFRFWA